MMFTNKTNFRPLALLTMPALAVGLLFTDSASAQVQIEVPELRIPALPELRMEGMGAIMDLQMMGSGNRSMTMSVENGVTKIKVSENGEKTQIETDQDGVITMKVTKKYTRENMDALQDEHPTLYMSVKGFPEEDEGSEVDFTLNVTKKYEAESPEELKEDHPEIFKIYEKYTKSGGNGFSFGATRELRGAIRDLGAMRGGIRVVPNGIILDDIKIHEDEDEGKEDESDSDEKDSSSKDKDT